jgi:hypothetical protein
MVMVIIIDESTHRPRPKDFASTQRQHESTAAGRDHDVVFAQQFLGIKTAGCCWFHAWQRAKALDWGPNAQHPPLYLSTGLFVLLYIVQNIYGKFS